MKKFLGVIISVILAVPTISFAQSSMELYVLVDSTVKESGLEALMIKDQPNDLNNLKDALLDAATNKPDVLIYLKQVSRVELPEIARLEDAELKASQYMVIQLNLTFMAAQNGYEERDN